MRGQVHAAATVHGCLTLTLTLTRYTRLLQYMGAHVIPSFNMMRAFTLREPYDFVVVARRDPFAAVRRPNAHTPL